MKKVGPTPKQIKHALESIGKMGEGMREQLIDWAQIGKNAKHLAKETMRPKCKGCGK